MYICIYVNTLLYICKRAAIHIYTHEYVFQALLSEYIAAREHTNIYIHIYIYTYTCIYKYIYT